MSIIKIRKWTYMFNLNFGGNPVVMELLESTETDIDKLLDNESFPPQFRNCNPKLEKYMDISKYNRLVQYITEVGDPNNRNRSYKYPVAAAEILSIDNTQTIDALFKEGTTIVEKIQTQQKWVEKQVDECDSQYCSSEGSTKNIQDFIQTNERQNIPPIQEKKTGSKKSVGQKKSNQKISQNESKNRNSLGSSSVSISSDDFPFADQKVKKVMVKQIIYKKVKMQVKPLLQQLCEYFDKQINHTLTGYVTRVLEFLLKKNPRKVIKEIFTTRTHKSLIKHLDSHSLCQFIINLLLCSENEAENARQFFIGNLFKTLINNYNDSNKSMQNKSIYYILNEIIAKLDPQSSKWHTVLMLYVFSESSFSKVSSIIFDNKTTPKNKQTCAFLLISCLKKLINPIIINPPNTAPSSIKNAEQENIKQLRQKILSKFEVCFKQFVDKVWQGLTEMEDKNYPSYVYLRQQQVLNLLIKNNLYWSRMELSSQESIFDHLLLLCRKFPNNNFIHNQVFDLLKEIVYISNQFPSLFSKTFNCKSFFIFCLETVSSYHSNSTHLYKGQCIYLCEAIRHSTSQIVVQFKQENKQKWQKIQEHIFGNIQQINKSLGGFSMKRGLKTEVLFEKEQIFQKFGAFLKGEIPMKKTKSMEQQQIQQLNSQGSAEWSDWNEFSNYSTDQIDEREQNK